MAERCRKRLIGGPRLQLDRVENGTALAQDPLGMTSSDHPQRIQLKLRDLSQLFNSMDPSPFTEKDLDHDAEEFIVSWAQEYSLKHPISLRIFLEQWPGVDPSAEVRTAIHHYFAYRANICDLDLRLLLRQGRLSLAIGVLFLTVCLLTIHFAIDKGLNSTWSALLRESLTIAGWVAMWRPMQIYLYEWWPIRHKAKVLRKLSKMHVEVVQKK